VYDELNIEASDGISRDQHAWIEVDFAAKNDFLYVAAGQFAHRVENTRRIDRQLGNDLPGLSRAALRSMNGPLWKA